MREMEMVDGRWSVEMVCGWYDSSTEFSFLEFYLPPAAPQGHSFLYPGPYRCGRFLTASDRNASKNEKDS